MNLEHLTDLLDEHEGRVCFEGVCHDCRQDTRVDITALADGIHIDGGAVYETVPGTYMIKCDGCFKFDPVLRNYQECLVYARIVGYLTPVKQWNDAKKAEFHDRVNYIPDLRA